MPFERSVVDVSRGTGTFGVWYCCSVGLVGACLVVLDFAKLSCIVFCGPCGGSRRAMSCATLNEIEIKRPKSETIEH